MLSYRDYYISKRTKLIAVILLFLMILISGMSFAIDFVYAEEVKFEHTKLEDDLESIDGFDYVKYPPDATGKISKPRIFNVYEYAYPYYKNYRQNYGLYIYFYNPQLLDINVNSVLNKVNLGVEYEYRDNGLISTNYEKFSLKFCSKTTGAYENLFYKFKVVDHKVNDKDMYERMNPLKRQYDIAEVELHTKGNQNATAYEVAGSFIFEGFAKGYGADPNSEATLKSIQRALEVISPSVTHTFFRTETSIYGKGYQNQLDGVYFNVPNSILKDYGELKRIKAEWYEYKTSPIVVTTEKDKYDTFINQLGVKFDGNNKLPYFATNYASYPDSGYSVCDWAFNVKPSSSFRVNDFVSNYITYLYYVDDDKQKDFILSGDELLSYIHGYDSSFHNGDIGLPAKDTGKNISYDLLNGEVFEKGHKQGYNVKLFDTDQINDHFNLLDYESNYSGWEKFFDYFLSYPADTSYNNIPPIIAFEPKDISLTNMAFSKKYLVDINDVDNCKNFIEERTKKGETVFKFNFSHTQYESNSFTKYLSLKEYGFMAQQTVYLNFDMIHLEFKNDLGYHVIPVVMSPIDMAGDITPPPFLNDNVWEIILKILSIVIGCIIFVLFILLLFKLLPKLIPNVKGKTKNNIKINIYDNQEKMVKSIDNKELKAIEKERKKLRKRE